MDIVFEVVDKTGRKIRLTKEGWSHISKHPAIAHKLYDLQEALCNPLKITEYSLDKNVRYYYKYDKQQKRAKYLRVIVKYLNGEGFIITAYHVEAIP